MVEGCGLRIELGGIQEDQPRLLLDLSAMLSSGWGLALTDEGFGEFAIQDDNSESRV